VGYPLLAAVRVSSVLCGSNFISWSSSFHDGGIDRLTVDKLNSDLSIFYVLHQVSNALRPFMLFHALDLVDLAVFMRTCTSSAAPSRSASMTSRSASGRLAKDALGGISLSLPSLTAQGVKVNTDVRQFVPTMYSVTRRLRSVRPPPRHPQNNDKNRSRRLLKAQGNACFKLKRMRGRERPVRLSELFERKAELPQLGQMRSQ